MQSRMPSFLRPRSPRRCRTRTSPGPGIRVAARGSGASSNSSRESNSQGSSSCWSPVPLRDRGGPAAAPAGRALHQCYSEQIARLILLLSQQAHQHLGPRLASCAHFTFGPAPALCRRLLVARPPRPPIPPVTVARIRAVQVSWPHSPMSSSAALSPPGCTTSSQRHGPL
jgi:hypothetical protein